jgi:2-methylisocitrate lyase-like PEP mutase family enzyme
LNQKEKAEFFQKLHRSGRVLILPNAWDVPSARVFENAGFPAVATTSAGLAVSLGYPDGEKISRKDMLATVRRITKTLTIPLSADIESGFGSSTSEMLETVKGVIDAGGIGINIEDIADFGLKTLWPIEKQVQRIREIRRLADSMGIPLVINGRTDAYRLGQSDEPKKLEEAILRSNAYGEAGADCTYPIGITDRESIRKVVSMVNYPVNVMARPGLPPLSELQEIGVARVSIGPFGIYATMGLLKKISSELLDKGTYRSLTEGAINLAELNSLASRRKTKGV